MPKESILTVIVPLALLFAVIGGFVVWIRLFVLRAYSRLRDWAAENGFQIVKVHKKGWNPAGPFRGWNSRDQVIYFVRVRDREGTERDCWIRCRVWFSKQIDVKWT